MTFESGGFSKFFVVVEYTDTLTNKSGTKFQTILAKTADIAKNLVKSTLPKNYVIVNIESMQIELREDRRITNIDRSLENYRKHLPSFDEVALALRTGVQPQP